MATTCIVMLTGAPSVVAEEWVLQLGPISGFPQSGTAPFDANSPTPPVLTPFEGEDSDAANNVVRANDAVTYAWSVTGSNIDADAGTVVAISDVVFEQTITPTAPLTAADIEIEPLNPAECGAGSGVNYNLPGGPIVVTCNTGPYVTGDQNTVTIRVRPGGEALNGDSFSSSQRVYAQEADGDPTETTFDLATTDQGDTIYITARPEWNLTKHGFFGSSSVTNYDPDGAGPEPAQEGVLTFAVLQISSMRPFGNEALENPIVVHDELTFTDNSGSNVPYVGEYFVVGCTENGSAYPGVVYGHAGGAGGVPGNADNCGPIVRDGDTTSGFTLEFPPVDFSPLTYPTAYPASGSLLTGPFYVSSVRVAYFIPRDQIEASPSGDQTAQLFNAIGDFDPDGVSGTTSNFGGGFEPGYCSATENGLPVVDGGTGECDPNSPVDSSSDNVVGPTAIQYRPPGIGNSAVKETYRSGLPEFEQGFTLLPGQSAAKSEDGLVEPGMQWLSRVYSRNDSFYDQRGWLCDVFDNSTAVLADLSNVTSPASAPGEYARVSAAYGPDPADSVVEYGTVDLSGVDPMQSYNATTNRWEGDWSALTGLVQQGCAEDAFTTWYTDPAAVPGGIDAVNVVRARPIDGAVRNVTPQSWFLLGVGLQARETFYGGSYAGTTIPDGIVVANQMNRRYEEDVTNGLPEVDYHAKTFGPSPLVADLTGERVTVRRATLTVLKRTIQDVDTGYTDVIGDPILSTAGSDYNITGAGVAGDYVVWEMTPTISSELGGSSLVTEVTLTDVLPSGVSYDPVCTSAITGGTPVTSASTDTPVPGATTLTWLLGDRSPADVLGDFRICTVTDDFADNGTAYVNSVTFSADGLDPAVDTHTVTVAQANRTKIQKTVDAPLDLLDDDQVWTTTMRNFSNAISPETPRLLEVFPYIGDATTSNGGSRSPASAFTGTNLLTAMPEAVFLDGSTAAPGEFWFTADDPATIDQDPDSNVSGDATNWCSTPDGGATWVFVSGPGSAADCPAALADASGFLYTSENDLATSTDPVLSGIAITFELQASGNTPGDTYTNRFTADSPTFPAAQYLLSNIVTVTTVGFQLGDFVWIDANENGDFDSGELPVPDGVTVELFASDGTPLAATTTTSGTYRFAGLRGGDYYVRIPASEFQAGGLLEGWDITPAAAEAGDIDVNDAGGHNGSSPGGVTVDGIVSETITVSATVSGDTLTGNEPLLDNTHGLVTDPFQDGFNNFTLDLAVVQPDIDIELVTQLTLGVPDSTGFIGAGDAPSVAPVSPVLHGDSAFYDVLWVAATESPFPSVDITWELFGPVAPIAGSCETVNWGSVALLDTGVIAATQAGEYVVGAADPSPGCYSYAYSSPGVQPRIAPFHMEVGDRAETILIVDPATTTTTTTTTTVPGTTTTTTVPGTTTTTTVPGTTTTTTTTATGPEMGTTTPPPPPTTAPAPTGPDPTVALPTTGTRIGLWLAVGLLALAAGLVLLRVRREPGQE